VTLKRRGEGGKRERERERERELGVWCAGRLIRRSSSNPVQGVSVSSVPLIRYALVRASRLHRGTIINNYRDKNNFTRALSFSPLFSLFPSLLLTSARGGRRRGEGGERTASEDPSTARDRNCAVLRGPSCPPFCFCFVLFFLFLLFSLFFFFLSPLRFCAIALDLAIRGRPLIPISRARVLRARIIN